MDITALLLLLLLLLLLRFQLFFNRTIFRKSLHC